MGSKTLVTVPYFFQQQSYGVFAGVFCAVVGFITSYLIFSSTPKTIGISSIFFATIIGLQLVSALLVKYGQVTAAKRWERIFHTYEPLINYLTSFFVGLFIAFFIISLFAPEMVFSREDLFGEGRILARSRQSYGGMGLPSPFVERSFVTVLSEIFSVFWHNATVMVVAFALSLFFGAGSLFLIALNASIFAAGLSAVVHTTIPVQPSFFSAYVFIACNLGIMLFHTVPEVVGYLLSAIGGGIMGQALLAKALPSRSFSLVQRDVYVLFGVSLFVLLIASIIEMAVSKPLFLSRACSFNSSFVLLAVIVLVSAVFVFEMWRRKYAHK